MPLAQPFRHIFLDRHRDLRIPWKVMLFLALSTSVAAALFLPFLLAGLVTDTIVFAIAVAAIGVGSYVMTRFVNKKPFRSIGLYVLPGSLKGFIAGWLLGFLSMAGVFVVQYGLGYIVLERAAFDMADGLSIAASSLLLFMLGAWAEELFFRGYLFQTLMQGLSFLPAATVMSFCFSLAHGANPAIAMLPYLNIFLAGLWLSFAYLRTRGLWLPVGLHCSWNFSQTTLFGFPTSGQRLDGLQIFESHVEGPAWITGGDFGPEGGVLVTIALILCTWYILKAPYLNAPEGVITLDSLEDVLPGGNGGGEA